MTVTDYVYLPNVPENVNRDWMEEFRKHVILELKKSRTNLNRVDYATAEIVEDVYNLEPPSAPTFVSVTPGNCMIYVVVDCVDDDVARYDLAVSTVSTRKMQYYSALAHTDTKGYFHFPCTEPVWVWARAVRVEDETFEAASGWTQYTDSLGLGYVNVLTDAIDGKSGEVPNFTHMAYYGNGSANERSLYYSTTGTTTCWYGDETANAGVPFTSSDRCTGYWDNTVVYMGPVGTQITAEFTRPDSTPYRQTAFLVLLPDDAMTGDPADWTGKYAYSVGLWEVNANDWRVGVKIVQLKNDNYWDGSYHAWYNKATTTVGLSGSNLYPAYVDANGKIKLRIEIECSGANNTFTFKAGASYATTLYTVSDATYLYSATRKGIGIDYSDDSYIWEAEPVVINAINFWPVGDDSIDPGYLDMEHGGTGSDLGTGGAVGDILIAADATSMKRLAGNTTTTKKFLSQTGDGAASADPAWDLATHVILDSTWHTDSTTGTVARGDLITGQGATPKWTRLAKGTAYQVLMMDATATDIAWADRTHNVLSAWHGDSTTAAAVRGDIITAQGVSPLWTRLAAGTAGDILNMGTNEPQWSSAATLFGSGTDNYIPKFLVGATPTFADSIMSQTGTTAINLLCADAATNAATDLLVLKHDSSGTPATNFGSSILWQLDSDTQEDRDAAELTVEWTTATDATRTSKVEIFNVYNGNLIGFLHQPYDYSNLFCGYLVGNRTLGGTGSQGKYNVMYGGECGHALTTGYGNTTLGWRAGRLLSSGSGNTAFGMECMYNVSTINYNSAYGYQAFRQAGGQRNMILGAFAVDHSVTVNECVCIGYESGSSLGAVALNNGCVFIGNQSGFYETQQAKLFIDNTKRANEADGRIKALVYGIFAAANVNQYLTVNGNVIGQIESTDTNAVRNIATLRHNTTGVVANGLGTGLGFQIETSTTENTDAARISSAWVDSTHATRKANMILSVYDTAIRTGLTIAATGSGAALTADGTLTVGADDAGYDVTLYGATSGKRLLWDESADTLQLDGTLDLNGGATLGSADTDAITCTGRLIVRTVNDGDMDATDGTTAEIVFNSADSKFYGCTASGTPATWAALN